MCEHMSGVGEHDGNMRKCERKNWNVMESDGTLTDPTHEDPDVGM